MSCNISCDINLVTVANSRQNVGGTIQLGEIFLSTAHLAKFCPLSELVVGLCPSAAKGDIEILPAKTTKKRLLLFITASPGVFIGVYHQFLSVGYSPGSESYSTPASECVGDGNHDHGPSCHDLVIPSQCQASKHAK